MSISCSEPRERTRSSRASAFPDEKYVDHRQRSLRDKFEPPCAKTAAYQIADGVKYCWRKRR